MRQERFLLAISILSLTFLGVCVIGVGIRKSRSLAQAQVVAIKEAPAPQTFLRPGALRRGGTYEVYLDIQDGSFSKETIVETGTMNVVVMASKLRDPCYRAR